MNTLDIVSQRLFTQRIAGVKFAEPADVVSWMGAIQAQDYMGALWAVGLRIKNAIVEDIEQAIADRKIVRTWPLRRTLHFVAPTDVRWILRYVTPRAIANSRWLFQQFELDDIALGHCTKSVTKALQGGNRLTRPEIYKVLEAGGIATANQRGLHILVWLAQKGVICFGGRDGKQHTFVLLDEWVPEGRMPERDEALAELAGRYFTSHGPACLQDFIWWSGLTTAEARAAIEMAKSRLAQETINGQTYWLSASLSSAKEPSPTAHLLPAYDEYTVAYKDRSAVLNPLYAKQKSAGNGIFFPTIVVDGQIVGTWKPVFKKDSLVITPSYFAKLNKSQSRAAQEAASDYGKFFGATALLS